MRELKYDRQKAYEYAKNWAFKRNPKYYNFDNVGGDCTSFISQCVYAGSGVMNYTKDTGWYYINGHQKAPAWSGVEFFHRFFVNNSGVGPYGTSISMEQLEVGDIAQIAFQDSIFAHTVLVVKIESNSDVNRIYISSHTYDSFEKPLGTYMASNLRFVHINGVRK